MSVGIFIYDNNFDRLKASGGAILVNELNGLPCKKVTYIPKSPWLNTGSIKYDVNESNYLLNVSVGKLNKNLIHQLQKIKIGECKTLRDLSIIQESSEYKNCIQSIIKYLSRFNYDTTNMTQHSLYFCDKSLSNNTFNKHDNEYLGMHLDSYERQMLNERNKSRNRICINLGLQSRFLLFYRTPIMEMAKQIKNTSDNQNINEIYEKYMSLNIKEPIYRIEVKPFEFYIAPTESIIHDGSNWPSSSPDINLVFRGSFFYKKISIFTKLFNLIRSK
jgi:hypothetical protein